MTHPIIKTDNYILITSDEEIKEDCYAVHLGLLGEIELVTANGLCKLDKKIIAHLPLNNSPILEGVPLLPPLPNEEIDLAAQEYPFLFIEGYKKAKEKYKFTEEDIIEAFRQARVKTRRLYETLEYFSQPKLPVGFKVAIKNMKTAIDDHIITGWENVIIDGGVVQGRWIFE